MNFGAKIMKKSILIIAFCHLSFVCLFGNAQTLPENADARIADRQTYLLELCKQMKIDWPKNRTINIVSHGHSVPAGYFHTPEVRTFDSYPHLWHRQLAAKYPHAVINVIVTAIGGENAEQGAARFERDVLSLKPALVTIDYSLNDRRIGLERAKKAWISMIEKAQAAGVQVILLTPTPDTRNRWDDPQDPLGRHAAQVRALAAQYHAGLVESTRAFQEQVEKGAKIEDLMSHVNHPNRRGHELVAKELMRWFE
jgi:acyl-CoA thioesterase I